MSVRSYKRHTPQGPWDAIVIGSGIGGLTTAALLARRAGQRVLVLERHYTPGGFTHVFKRRDYEWDVGIHYVGDAHGGLGAIIDEVTGGAISWSRLPRAYDRIIFSDESYDLLSGRERFVQSLSQQFPRHHAAIERYAQLTQRVGHLAPAHFIAKQLASPVGRALGAATSALFHFYSDQTVEEVLRPVLTDPRLFDVLTGQWGDYGLTPRHASFAIHAMTGNHFMGGAYYPVGGPGVLSSGAVQGIGAAGGEVYTNAEVDKIVVEGGRAVGVRMVDGSTFRAPVVVSGAGVPLTLNRLLPRDVAEKTGLLGGVRGVGPSTAHICLHLGFRKSDAELGFDGTNLWVYCDGDREESFRRFADDPDADIPLTFMSFPSAKDPSWSERYPDRATVEVIALVPMRWFQKWTDSRWMKRGGEYDDFKAKMTERLLEKVYQQMPRLRGEVDHCELSTPLSTKHFAAHPDGEIYGLTHTPERFRLPLRARSGVPGLYFTGADIVTGGVGGAVIGGTLSCGAIMVDHLPALVRRRFSGKPKVTSTATPAPASAA